MAELMTLAVVVHLDGSSSFYEGVILAAFVVGIIGGLLGRRR